MPWPWQRPIRTGDPATANTAASEAAKELAKPSALPIKITTAASAQPTVSAVQPKQGDMTMSWFSTLISATAKDITGLFAKLIPSLTAEAKAEFATVEQSLVAFAKTDLGKLAIDAVNGASSLGGGVGGPAFLAAKATFLADAKTAGHDLETIGGGIVDWAIQTAYMVINGVVTQTAAGA